MDLLVRLQNLWRGFWILWVRRWKIRNPEAVYKSALNGRIKRYRTLKLHLITILHLRIKLAKRLMEEETTLGVVEQQIQIAVHNDEAALALIAQRNILREVIARLEGNLVKVACYIDDSKSVLTVLRDEIERLKVDRDWMLVRRHTASLVMNVPLLIVLS